jgi:hypothetical protein
VVFSRRRLEKCVGLTSEFTAYEKADAAEGSKLHPGTGQANFYPGYAQKCGFSCLEKSTSLFGMRQVLGIFMSIRLPLPFSL